MKSALLLYPHQLYPVQDLPKVDTVVLVEDPLYFGVDQEFPYRLHKQKLILRRASMRRYVEEVLWPAGFKVEYVDLNVFMQSGDVLDKVKKVDQLFVIDPTDDVLSKRLLAARRERTDLPNITFLASPNFYLKEQEVRSYFSSHKDPDFMEFYQWQRERFNVLIDENYKPTGGKWAYDKQHHKRLAEDAPLPSFGVFGSNQHVQEAVRWVQSHFPDNPGTTDFIWPTNHAEARAWLDDFMKNRIDNFALYYDTIEPRTPWLFHSLLASSLNIGLLKPQELVEAALKRHAENPVALENLELFIRQTLGWREFARGQYLHQAQLLRSKNPFNHQRKLTSAWYGATTGLLPLDDLIRKLHAHGYAHASEQRLIAANLMLLCEIQPSHIYRWFNEWCIDSYDWSLVPTVFGMNLFNGTATNGTLAIAPAESVIQVSNYQHDVWTDIWDGLYWRFVEKHAESFKKDKSLRVLAHRLEKLDPDHRRIISYRAEDFLTQHTAL